MRSLILSDIHGNLEALEAVLEQSQRESYDHTVVLGDLIGYGANPNEVVEHIFDLKPDLLIRGNHDKVASGVEEPLHFNPSAAKAAAWTYNTLTPLNRQRIANLPKGPRTLHSKIEICHGTPYDEDIYIFDEQDASVALDSASKQICFFGHTHLPGIFSRQSKSEPISLFVPQITIASPQRKTLNPRASHLINPGSIGQPRDGDPRAAYAIFDHDTTEVVFVRVTYPVKSAQEKILAAGLPDNLARRLAQGR
ncbi:metallophosphoesterase [bacterium]|nr:MAG: metallophosphoesterase [bacterium]